MNNEETCGNASCNRQKECRRFEQFNYEKFTFVEQSDGFHYCAAFLPKKKKTLNEHLQNLSENFNIPKTEKEPTKAAGPVEETEREKALKSLRGM